MCLFAELQSGIWEFTSEKDKVGCQVEATIQTVPWSTMKAVELNV